MSKKTIVVVGAGQGLGNHVAERFAQEDFRVVLVARRSDALAEYRQAFEAKGYEVGTVACDVTDTEIFLCKSFCHMVAKSLTCANHHDCLFTHNAF